MGALHILSGDDDFARKRRARELVAGWCGADFETDPALEIVEGDGDGRKFDDIAGRLLDTLRTPSFLADRQVVWVRNFAFFDDLAGGRGRAAALLEELTAPRPEEQTVLISGPGFDQRKSYAKTLKTAGAAVEICSTGRPTDRNFADNRRQRIQELCAAAGKRIAPTAVQYLEAALGSGSGTLTQELEKLFCYVGDAPEITPEDCRAVCSRTPEAVSWNFTAALVERDPRTALTLLDTLLKQGEAAVRVLAAVSGEFQQLIQVRLAMTELKINRASARTFDAIPEAVRAAHPDNPLLKMHPFRAFKTCERAERFTGRELAGALRAVLEANRKLVSGAGEPRIVLEQLIFAVTGR